MLEVLEIILSLLISSKVDALTSSSKSIPVIELYFSIPNVSDV